MAMFRSGAKGQTAAEPLDLATVPEEPRVSRRPSAGRRSWRLWGMPLGVVVAALGLLVLVLSAVFAPLLTTYDPVRVDLVARMQPPMWLEGGSSEHILGTDQLGRDLWARMIHGARISLGVAALVAIFGGGVGAAVGIAAAYFGGKVDIVLSRLIDIVMALPTILVAILLAVAIGPSFINIVVVISILLWPKIARQVRGDALVIKEQDYIEYSQAIGVPPLRLMFRHFLPNVTPALLVITTLEIGAVILTEATLGFLGAGVPPPTPSWGLIVAEGSRLLATGWWIALFPGLAIMVTILIFNTLGDWLRDHLDPRLKQR
jgi:peptide/nickel transport system permease protein